MVRKTLFNIPVEKISPNPNNPRIIFNADELDELKKSIEKVGILVPVTVFENTKKVPKTKYILLDGERRLRCAKELGLETIPANIIDEPEDVTQNILFMFNIHHFRREWELFPTALKLQVIIDKTGTDRESTLAEFTGVKRSTIRRCKMLLWFPKKYRNVLMEQGGKISTDFFIELYPIAYRMSHEEEYAFPKGSENLVDTFINKFLAQKVVTDVKEFREIRKAMGYYEDISQIEQFKSCLKSFLENEDVGLEVFASPEIENVKAYQVARKYISYLNANLKLLNPDLVSDLNFVEQLRTLMRNIQKLLEEIE
jgi:ParB family chromosome partitioning protein